MIIHIIGQPASGKSTISRELEKFLKSTKFVFGSEPIIIDGDEVRKIFGNQNYTEDGRKANLRNAYNIAKFLDAKGFTPILAMVSPFLELREELKSSNEVKEIYLTTSQIRGRESFFVENYEKPLSNFLEINTDSDLNICLEEIIDYVITK
jgi:adenylylsulfate kinase-like enzyme